jgi:FkbM family methyltransferase
MAFESQRIAFQTLCANVALNNHANVFTYQKAFGSVQGAVIVAPVEYQPPGNLAGAALEKCRQGEEVPLVTVDGLKLTHCNFIKIDMKGIGPDVILGDQNTLARLKPFLYVINDGPAGWQELTRNIDAQGYRMFWDRPSYFNPNNYLENRENVFGQMVSLNIFCVHRDVAANIEGMAPVEVPQ